MTDADRVETPAPRRARRWKLWAGLGLVLIVIAAMLTGRSPVDRAKSVRPGMARSEVQQIMGPSQLWFRAQVHDDHGDLRIESGECWDYGGVPRAYLDHFRRKLGVLRSFKTRAEFPVEIRFDDGDRVDVIEIRVEP